MHKIELLEKKKIVLERQIKMLKEGTIPEDKKHPCMITDLSYLEKELVNLNSEISEIEKQII